MSSSGGGGEEANAGTIGNGAGEDAWVNVGLENWKALRHEWKYRPPAGTTHNVQRFNHADDTEHTEVSVHFLGPARAPRNKKRYDPEVIYAEITGPRKGQLSQPVPLQDLVGVLTWVWESENVW